VTISARDLGYFASPDYCPRCAWVKLNVKPLPYQIFPGIFSSIDSYNKNVVRAHFDRNTALPQWLAVLGDVREVLEPPHWKQFSVTDADTGLTLRGQADAIFRLQDGSYVFGDYKTAKHTPGQDALFPLYEVQLNSYAYIGPRRGFQPVSKLALIYMEPLTDERAVSIPAAVNHQGFTLGFRATIVPVELSSDVTIPPLLRKVREVADMDRPPEPGNGCKDCRAMDELLNILR